MDLESKASSLRIFRADLHIHSVLSPCASVEMTPRNIVLNAADCGIDIIAITDHNAADNVAAALAAAAGTRVHVLPGMEIETREEAHLLVLFDDLDQMDRFSREVGASLPGLPNDERKLGAQFVVDCEDNLVGVRDDLLLTATSLSVADVTRTVASLGGLTVASHVDRPAYSILGQLGFIPPGAGIDAVEVSRRFRMDEAHKIRPLVGELPIIKSSDAHTIDDFVDGPKTSFYIERPSIAEIRQAFRGLNSRKVIR